MQRRDLTKSLLVTGLIGLGVGAKAKTAVSPNVIESYSQALLKDIPIIRQSLTSLHPGLYRYLSANEFEAGLDNLSDYLSQVRSPGDCYARLSHLLSTIRCGHTYANFFNQSGDIKKIILDPANKLPFYFRWIDQKMVIIHNPLGLKGLKLGTIVKKINGVKVSDILQTLIPYVRADGSNHDKRRALLNVTGDQGIETFDVFFPLVFPDASDHFLIETTNSKLKVPKWDQTQRRSFAPIKPDKFSEDYWSLRRSDDVAILQMDGWGLYNVKWDWQKKIRSYFEQIEQWGITKLIIDLRQNEGGLDCGHEIIRYLVDAPIRLSVDYERRVIFRQTPSELNPYLDTWDSSFKTLGMDAFDLGNGYYRLSAPDSANQPGVLIEPTGPRFQGAVAILSSATNSSATFQFIAQMRRLKLARIYGESTGGNQRGINGGAFFFLRLPHSGIEIDLPLIGTFPVDERPDAGLMPDILIKPRPQDIERGLDRVLQVCLNSLRAA